MDARAWDERYAASELVWTAGPNQFVEAECAGLTPGEALDLACGEGRNAIWLARQGWRVVASDFSQVALDKGRALAGDLPVTWRCEDATTWDPAAEALTVDLAVLAYLQLPAAERSAAVRHAFGALAPGGTLHRRGPRLEQPRRGHRRPAGPGRALHRRRRARRPRRRVVRRGARGAGGAREVRQRRRPRRRGRAHAPGTAWCGVDPAARAIAPKGPLEVRAGRRSSRRRPLSPTAGSAGDLERVVRSSWS